MTPEASAQFARRSVARTSLFIAALAIVLAGEANLFAAPPDTVTVLVTPQPVNVFSPQDALGACVDSTWGEDLNRLYSATNLAQMLAAGHGALAYRLNSELGVADWHWNPAGTWSDTNGDGRGYFTGSAEMSSPGIVHSRAYALPHRGLTTDEQGSDRYSMLTDGDPATYWKSNPYLTTTATGEPDAEHPQWVVIDLGEEKSVNAIGISWTNPFAVNYKVQFWEGDDAIGNPAGGAWKTFPNGTVTNGVGGTERRQLSATDMSVRFVRVLMSVSSGTFDTHGTNDARNSMGYAIAEVSVGTLSDGRLTDAVKHSPDKRQTATFVSSTDPWHAPDDKMADTEQPGLDFIFTNGITRGLPALVPVGLLYSTPDNALAEIKYLRERGYAISHVEIGEEPDGQHCTPEDYAALYLQWASALHGYDATLKLGGPAFQEGREDVKTWPDANGETSWLKRFIKYLSARGKLGELNFMSFEHYPFEPCANAWTSLADEPGIVRRIMAAWRADGLPTNVPILCTEYNFSWDATAAHQQLAGALWHADFVGSFLAAGGAGAYYYQYEPLALVKNSGCGQWGAFGMFTADASRQIKQKTSQFFSSQLINEEWLKPGREPHRVFAAHTDVRDAKGNELVTAYAVARPDDKWSVMLINKDATHAHALRLQFSNTVTHVVTTAAGARELVQFSSAQYVWHAGGAKGFANPNLPPVLTTNAPGALITLAPASLNVVRCAGP